MTISDKLIQLFDSLEAELSDEDKEMIETFLLDNIKNSDDHDSQMLPAEPSLQSIMDKLNNV